MSSDNPRILDRTQGRKTSQKQLEEMVRQADPAAFDTLLENLRGTIINFVPIYALAQGERRQVLEGNRRTACFRILHRENPEVYQHANCFVIPEDHGLDEKELAVATKELMMVLHMVKQADWHSYNQTLILADLHDRGLSEKELAARFGKRTPFINRKLAGHSVCNEFASYCSAKKITKLPGKAEKPTDLYMLFDTVVGNNALRAAFTEDEVNKQQLFRLASKVVFPDKVKGIRPLQDYLTDGVLTKEMEDRIVKVGNFNTFVGAVDPDTPAANTLCGKAIKSARDILPNLKGSDWRSMPQDILQEYLRAGEQARIALDAK